MDQSQRNRQAQVASWVGIIANVILAILKGIAGWISGSRALVADAAHSASDVVSSVAVLAGVSIANKPPDDEHPYGHGKAENIATIIVSMLLILVGFEIAWSSIKVFWGDTPTSPTGLALIVTVIAIAAKEALFQYKNRLGKRINSPALIADSWHHRSDALSSFGVLLGVGGAMIGKVMGIEGLLYMDPIAGIVVALFIIGLGYKMARESFDTVLENVLGEEESRRFIRTVEGVPGVVKVDKLLARVHGAYVIVDLKISVDARLDVEKAHLISKKVKNKLITDHEEVNNVLVHINPY
ncbi:cation diffusion facilitator family transporter [Salimicrobium halophilum]|uniref:Cation diffusion facilitator family transporter n=1 Tax=Salimicrobium halophilum TaxID=86666 RepID=A0A1G8QW00_9BACI|nr:cation diffusion facilitator family transporter [Salimicrobium halophilum]SDJ08803.1 cation diffusion facilitator family transporter [Salimicrobium halophilum]